MTLPENVARLVNIIKKGETNPEHGAFLWTGAGLSIPAGYPSWGQLIERLRAASVEPLDEVSDPLEAIDAFVRANGKGLLSQQLLEIFDQKQPLPYHQELMQFPWKGIVTTNYDELLEDTLKRVGKPYVKVTLEQNLDLVAGNRLPLLKVHGDIASFRDVVLAGESYDTFHDRHPLLKAALESYLRKYSLVFFGCSMTDPRLLGWLRGMSADNRQQLMPSCAVLTEEVWNRIPAEDRGLLEEGNIRPILVQDHSEIPELISHVLRQIPSAQPQAEGFQIDIAFTREDQSQWRMVSNGQEHVVDVPWKGSNDFGISLRGFVALTQKSVNDDQRTELNTHATRLGDSLGQALLRPDTWQRIREAFTQNGPQPLTIASDDDLILSLPWELLRVNSIFVVREGTIDLIRTTSSSAPNPAMLTPPDRYLKLVVNVSAPQAASQLDYEAESYRLVRALHDHSEVVLTELGTVDDLVDAVVHQDPTGVHFSGHGEPGALVFEDDEGQEQPIAIEALLQKIRQEDRNLPRFFYLASCHGNTAPDLDANRPGTTLSSAHLHREGVVQVVGYYGPIADTLSTLAEEAFYRSLAEGRTTRSAIRQARLALVARPEVDGGTSHKAEPEAAIAQMSRHPFAWAQLVVYHRGPDYPLSQKLPERYAQTQEAQLQRSFTGTDQRQILSTGFIGRRQELHHFRRSMRRGQRVFVFQGLGGLGKSTLAFKALPILSRDGQYPSLTIWCQELEHEDNLARALINQFSESAQTLFGEQWIGVVQAVDQMPEATEPQRFGFFLQTMLENMPHLVLYLDNLESLLRGPDDEDPEAFGEWRSEELQDIWTMLKSHSGDKLSVVASCRYRHASFEADTIHVPEMHDAAIFRMMGWFDGLRQLSLTSRAELVRRLHGHPRAVEFLDALIRDSLAQWENRYGEWVPPRTLESIQDEWQLIAPALPDVETQLRTNLLLDAIWNQILDDRCHRMLFRMTLLRRPWDWDLMMQLDDDDAEDQTEATIGKLRATSLLGEIQEWRRDRWLRLFQMHSTTVKFITERTDASEANFLKQTAYLRVGTYLEEMAKTSTILNDYLDAGHYLLACGEFDRAYELIGPTSQWLQQRGMFRTSITILAPFEAVTKQMAPEHQGRLLDTLGTAYHSLSQFKRAIEYHNQALTISREFGDRWGKGTNLGNLGNAYYSLGEIPKAIEYYQQALTISREIGDRQGEGIHLGNLGNAYHSLGEIPEAIEYHEQALTISREIGDRQGEGRHLGNLGIVYYPLGEIPKAIDCFQQALTISREIGDRQGEGRHLGNLGNGYHSLGEIPKAIEYYQQALAISREIGDRQGEGNRLGNLGSSYKALGELDKAQAFWLEALTKLLPGTPVYKQVEGWLQASE